MCQKGPIQLEECEDARSFGGEGIWDDGDRVKGSVEVLVWKHKAQRIQKNNYC